MSGSGADGDILLYVKEFHGSDLSWGGVVYIAYVMEI